MGMYGRLLSILPGGVCYNNYFKFRNIKYNFMAEKKTKKSSIQIKGRPKPSAPRSGFKASGSRYENGGKITRKKSV